MDEHAVYTEAMESKDRALSSLIILLKCYLLTLFLDDFFEGARKLALNFRSSKLEGMCRSIWSDIGFPFCRDGRSCRCKKRKSDGKRALNRLKKHAEANTANKICLIEAEWLALQERWDLAVCRYNRAISIAKNQGFIHKQGLACERAGLGHCRELDNIIRQHM